MARTAEIIQNDTDDLDIYLKKNNGAWDIDGATAAELTMKDKSSGTLKIDASGCTIQDATLGYVTYTPNATDFDTAGDYELQVKVTLASGKRRSTKRLTATIEEELA